MALTPGTKLGAFEITGLLGKGGMGEVYRARDTKLGRDVAIKVVSEAVASDTEYLKRFEREARTLASLDHPNIGGIFEFREADGAHFLVMQLVEGDTLSDRIRQGRLSLREALPLFVQIARGLDAAHEAGIVHRDLKPANIKISPRGEVKVLDFGIAKDLTKADIDPNAPTTPMTSSPVTGEGLLVGTPQYMSPEQARGRPVDRRTDVWAFGCCLYEALTGSMPFNGETFTDIVSEIIQRDPEWSKLPNLPPRVESILRRSLEKDPHRRLSSMGDIAILLEEAQEALRKGAPAASDSKPDYLKTGVSIAIVLGLILGAFLAGLRERNGLRDAEPDRGAELARPAIASLAVLPLDNLMNDPEQDYFVDGMTEAITAELAKIGALKVISRTSSMQYKDTQLGLPEIAAALGVDAIIEGSVLRSNDDVRITAQLVHGASDEHVWAESYNGTLEDILALQSDVALAIAQAIQIAVTPEEKSRISERHTTVPEAYDEYLRGDHVTQTRSETGMRAAIAHFERAIALDSDFAAAYARLASTYALLSLYWFEDPETGFPKAEEYAREALAIDEHSGEAYGALALTSTFYHMDMAETIRYAKRGVDLNPNESTAHFWYGGVAAFSGHLDIARVEYEKAVALDPVNPLNRIGLDAQVPFFAGDSAEAERNFRRIAEDVPDHPFLLWGQWANDMAGGDADGVLAAAEHLKDLFEPNPSYRALWGAALAGAGDVERARAVLEEIEHLPERTFVSSHALAELHFALGDNAKGYEYLARARGDLFGLAGIRTSPSYRRFHDDERYWEIVDAQDFPPLPPSHPLYAKEQERLIQRAAEELLAEHGLTRSAGIDSLAVLPFDNYSGDPALEYRSDGMTDTLTAELAKIGALTVKARTSAMRYKNTDKPFKQIADELGVDALVEGSIQMDDTDIVITAQLVDGRTGNHVWAQNFSGTVEGVLKLQGQVAIAIAEELDAVLTAEETERLERPQTVDARAWDLYLKGLDAWINRPNGSVDPAIEPLNRAIEIAPEFSDAIALLAMVHRVRGLYAVESADDRALSTDLAKRAYALDPSSVYANLGLADFGVGSKNDWSDTYKHIEAALRSDPGNSYAHISKGIYYHYLGRHADALAAKRRAQELDPLAAVNASEVMRSLYQMGDYAGVIREGEAARELFPNNWLITRRLATAYGHAGRVDDALALIPEARDPNVTTFDISQVLILTACGRAEDVERLLDEANYEAVGQRLMLPLLLLDRRDEIFYFMNKPENNLDGFFRSSLSSLQFQPLWGDDRFWAALDAMGLPQFSQEHPAHEHQQRYLINKRAEELIAERGLVPAEAN